jgi:hypothetical protein
MANKIDSGKLLPRLASREEYFDFLDGWSIATPDKLSAKHTTRSLVKGYLLETSAEGVGRQSAAEAFELAGEIVEVVDDTLCRLVRRGEQNPWAICELTDDRYPMLFSALEAKESDRRVDLLARSPMLDKIWITAELYEKLWQRVVAGFDGNRYTRMVSEYESIYESTTLDESDDALVSNRHESSGNDEEPREVDEDEDVEVAIRQTEKRRARMVMSERISRMVEYLPKLREVYGPLESTIALRIPAPQRGGHDVYFDGKFTNRSESVVSLRSSMTGVRALYGGATRRTEAAAWPRESSLPGISLGSPLLIQFKEPLSLSTFDRWIDSLSRRRNAFRLLGNPIDRGPGKVQIYGLDHHLWQPIDVEVTRSHLYAMLPDGTCGNSIHRLIANVQRLVSPRIDAFIGDRRYGEFLQEDAA